MSSYPNDPFLTFTFVRWIFLLNGLFWLSIIGRVLIYDIFSWLNPTKTRKFVLYKLDSSSSKSRWNFRFVFPLFWKFCVRILFQRTNRGKGKKEIENRSIRLSRYNVWKIIKRLFQRILGGMKWNVIWKKIKPMIILERFNEMKRDRSKQRNRSLVIFLKQEWKVITYAW